MWFMADPKAAVRSWWFILPDHGVCQQLGCRFSLLPTHDVPSMCGQVAIELQDGAVLSWDGRNVMHCSSVPDADTDLYSAWCSAQQAAMNRHDEDEALREELKQRCVPGGIERPTYQEGDKAGLLWQTSLGEVRSYEVEITEVLPNKKLLVTDLKASQRVEMRTFGDIGEVHRFRHDFRVRLHMQFKFARVSKSHERYPRDR